MAESKSNITDLEQKLKEMVDEHNDIKTQINTLNDKLLNSKEKVLIAFKNLSEAKEFALLKIIKEQDNQITALKKDLSERN